MTTSMPLLYLLRGTDCEKLALVKGLLLGSTPMGSARKRVKNEIFEFGSDFVSFGPGEVGIV